MTDQATYAALSDAVYNINSSNGQGFLAHTSSGNWRPILVDDKYITTNSNGFAAVAFKNDSTGEIVIAYRGSDGLFDFIPSNLQIALGWPPAQANNALSFYESVKNAANPGTIISVTGHSLGGALAQIVASNYKGLYAETFNAPGMVGKGGSYSNIVNHVVLGDYVGSLSQHIGSTKYYMPDNKIDGGKYKPHADYLDLQGTQFISGLDEIWTEKHAAALTHYDTKNVNGSAIYNSGAAVIAGATSVKYLEEAVNIIQQHFGATGLLTQSLTYKAGTVSYSIGDSSGDTIRGYDLKSDTMYGNGGDDYLYGGSGKDFLYGGDDTDRLYGGSGNDTLDGGSGTDYLYGGSGNDELRGGYGKERDYLYGESGFDTCKVLLRAA